MAGTAWRLERFEKAAVQPSWTGEFPDFAQALEFATAVLGSGREESVRFAPPTGAPAVQIKQLVQLGAWERNE